MKKFAAVLACLSLTYLLPGADIAPMWDRTEGKPLTFFQDKGFAFSVDDSMAHLYDRPTVEISISIPNGFALGKRTNEFDSLSLENKDLSADLQTFAQAGKQQAILTISEAMAKKSRAIFYFKHGAKDTAAGPPGTMYVLDLAKVLNYWKKSKNHPAAHLEAAPTFSGGDGSSLGKAIMIQGANDEGSGVAAERNWLELHYPGFEKGRQALMSSNGRQYDQIEFTTMGGEHKSVYFDITAFFGK